MVIEEKYALNVKPRFVRDENGLRPFQSETISLLKDNSCNLITVEAPVGSGKSYVIRNLIQDDYFNRKPIILTYPTKILMEAQVNSIKKEIKNVPIAMWPESEPVEGGINILNYSSDSLINFLSKQSDSFELNKSDLIANFIRASSFNSKKLLIVTTPDVLHLLVNREVYKSSKRIKSFLSNCIVFFDEYHLYFNYRNFPILVNNLLDSISSKVVVLSATPYASNELQELNNKFSCKTVSFSNSVGSVDDKIFNYELDVEIHSYKYKDISQSANKIIELLKDIEKPAAVIFDSVFRLKQIKRLIESNKMISENIKVVEWSGLQKDKGFVLDNKTVVLGTASIEVGIDMKFKTLITEASNWASAIQRIGRVGRLCSGKAIILTSKRFNILDNFDKEVDRDIFENEIIKETLNDPAGRIVSGESFRGNSYNFLLIDSFNNEPIMYSENLFSMFKIDDCCDDWQSQNMEQKKQILTDFGLKNKDKINELLLRDKLFPFWGLLKGNLRNKYSKCEAKFDKDTGELTIIIDDTEHLTFYKD